MGECWEDSRIGTDLIIAVLSMSEWDVRGFHDGIMERGAVLFFLE